MSKYFYGSDDQFPRDILLRLKHTAETHGPVKFEYNGDNVRFRTKPYGHEEVLITAVKTNEDGTYNYWTDTIYDGRHHYAGPGYPNTAVFPQKPVDANQYVDIISRQISDMSRRCVNEGKTSKKKINEEQIRKIIRESYKKIMVNEAFDPEMPVIIVGGQYQGRYKGSDLLRMFDITRYNDFGRQEIQGFPKLPDYLGPMWDGDKVRYESQDVYDTLSV